VHSTPHRPSGTGRAPRTRRRWGLLALLAAPFVLSGCALPNFGAFKSATSQGRSTFHLWQGFSIGAIVIGVFTLVLIGWAALRYRTRKGDDPTVLPSQRQYHLPLEITYTVVPIIIVFALFAATVVVENKVTALPPPATTIRVYAFRWGWQFTYPSGDFSQPTAGFSILGQTTQNYAMVIPENENVRISLQSLDVVHGFYIRKFNFSRYALPGVDNLFTFNAQSLGTYFGQCTQFCGLWHSLMWFRVTVVTPAAYKVWLAKELSQATIASSIGAKIAASQLTGADVPVKPAIGAGVK
jgi:cytochrome c oxidase subunit 2